jgi:DHA1 family bicyclomycin/chloramphenicol resistance-like MFS transporter
MSALLNDAPPITPTAPAKFRPPPLWLLALLTFSGTLAMHIFIPALPIASADLGTNSAAIQLTISFYIFGLALGQLIVGPLADRFGRRPVLMVGLCLYTIAGLASALAPDINFLLVARLFQALGGCTGLVLGRAIVRDTSELSEAARRLALMNLVVVLGPGVAPIIGGAMAEFLGWRSIYFALCGMGFVGLVLTWFLLPETGGLSRSQSSANVMRSYGHLFSSPAFLGYAIGGGCSTTSMYAFIAAAPFVFINDLHRSGREVGIYLAIIFIGIWLGSLVASRLARRTAIANLMVKANLLSLASALFLLIVVLTGHLSVILAVGSMMVFTFGVGIASPSAMAEALSVNPRIAGSSSGVYGFSQMTIGAICTALVGLGSDQALSSAVVLVGISILGQFAFWIANRASRSN